MGIAKVTRNYQVTIPKDIRRIQGIEVGDTILFVLEGNKVDFVKMERDDAIKAVAGIWKGEETGVEYVRRIRSGWKRRSQRLGI